MLRQMSVVGTMLAKGIPNLPRHVTFPEIQYAHTLGFPDLKPSSDGHPAWLSEKFGGTQP